MQNFHRHSLDAQSSEKFEFPNVHAPCAEVEQGNILPSCFSSHTASKHHFHGMFRAMFFAFLCFLLVTVQFKV